MNGRLMVKGLFTYILSQFDNERKSRHAMAEKHQILRIHLRPGDELKEVNRGKALSAP